MNTRFCPTCGNDATANGLCAHRCPPDWRAIAERLAATLANLQREARAAEDGNDFTRDVIDAKWPALDEFDRAKEGT